jgi:hypothetical protein
MSGPSPPSLAFTRSPWARRPHNPVPGFLTGAHFGASVFALCSGLQSGSPLDQVPLPSQRQRLLHPSFPHQGSPPGEVGYHYAANRTPAAVGPPPTGRVRLWAARATCAFTSVTARGLAHHPFDGFVGGLQSLGFPPPCHPSYGALALTPAGLTPAEHVSFLWTHG